MSGQFTTSSDDMRKFSAHLADVSQQIQQELRRLEGVVSTVAGGWSGDAAIAYQTLQGQWNEDAGKLNTVLGEIKDAIDATTSQYTATEGDQSHAMSKITAALG
ncbi:WXG100 family type VII secretion target [Streptacidiphilus sp. 4-A2]|nr:WXG100 family type VII secretion target [Streptacidiphilus sp. 4-A2]